MIFCFLYIERIFAGDLNSYSSLHDYRFKVKWLGHSRLSAFAGYPDILNAMLSTSVPVRRRRSAFGSRDAYSYQLWIV
jgi:hypothetical protein